MKTAIAIRHLDFEDLGTLEPLLAARGYDVRYLDAATDDLQTVDTASANLLVVLAARSVPSMTPSIPSSATNWRWFSSGWKADARCWASAWARN